MEGMENQVPRIQSARTPKWSLTETAMKGMAVHFSSQTPEWATPQWLFEALDKEFGFTLDPCSTHANAKCTKHFTWENNGLLATPGSHVNFALRRPNKPIRQIGAQIPDLGSVEIVVGPEIVSFSVAGWQLDDVAGVEIGRAHV